MVEAAAGPAIFVHDHLGELVGTGGIEVDVLGPTPCGRNGTRKLALGNSLGRGAPVQEPSYCDSRMPLWRRSKK